MQDKIKGRILHVINGDLGDANTSYTYFNMSQDEMRYATIQFTIEATTITLEATDDTAADISATWTDVTLAMTGAANAVASGMWIIDTPFSVRRCRIKRLTTNAINALDIFLTLGD